MVSCRTFSSLLPEHQQLHLRHHRLLHLLQLLLEQFLLRRGLRMDRARVRALMLVNGYHCGLLGMRGILYMRDEGNGNAIINIQ